MVTSRYNTMIEGWGERAASLCERERQQRTAISGHAQPSFTAATSQDMSLPLEY